MPVGHPHSHPFQLNNLHCGCGVKNMVRLWSNSEKLQITDYQSWFQLDRSFISFGPRNCAQAHLRQWEVCFFLRITGNEPHVSRNSLQTADNGGANIPKAQEAADLAWLKLFEEGFRDRICLNRDARIC